MAVATQTNKDTKELQQNGKAQNAIKGTLLIDFEIKYESKSGNKQVW